MLPGMATSKSFRPTLLELMARVGLDDEDMRLDFHDFLRLVREFKDLNENDRIDKERNAVTLTNFSNAEARAFREIFISIDENELDCLSFDQVKEMIHRVTPLGDKLTGRLRGMWPGKVPKV